MNSYSITYYILLLQSYHSKTRIFARRAPGPTVMEPPPGPAIRDQSAPSITGWWLSPTPLKNMSSSIGMMTFPINMGK